MTGMDKNGVWAVIAAAGSGTRVGDGRNKLLLELGGMPLIARTLLAFENCGCVDGIAVSCSESDEGELREIAQRYGVSKAALFVRGGKTRQQSVMNALEAVKAAYAGAEIVLIHDGARPFISRGDIARCIAGVGENRGCIVGRAVTDTIKEVSGGKIDGTRDRSKLFAAQTPQGFMLADILDWHLRAEKDGFAATDDAMLAERYGGSVGVIETENSNMKITVREDFAVAEAILGAGEQRRFRSGVGYDVHRLVEGRELILCGVTVPFEKGLLGHSDADVAAHALTDAIFGAAAMGDIGEHFPDSDERYKGASSIKLLETAVERVKNMGFAIVNCDISIVCQRPKLLNYKDAMHRSIARAIGCELAQVSIKAKTTEGLGFEGRGEGISCYATAMLEETYVE